ncbi:hypothetical protein TREES_T100012527 [Tupaia chinensis]|uniref:Uncharacterized protein n=1 Tax=Tupaia chinensis TaxID=246437 RepID=L8YAQ4_TUPCH|nr:hypothetical protein TREES_T100012527 [Tupaia chinensis]
MVVENVIIFSAAVPELTVTCAIGGPIAWAVVAIAGVAVIMGITYCLVKEMKVKKGDRADDRTPVQTWNCAVSGTPVQLYDLELRPVTGRAERGETG